MPWHLCLAIFLFLLLQAAKKNLFSSLSHQSDRVFKAKWKCSFIAELPIWAWVLTWSSQQTPPGGHWPHREPKVVLSQHQREPERGLDEDPLVDCPGGKVTREGGAGDKTSAWVSARVEKSREWVWGQDEGREGGTGELWGWVAPFQWLVLDGMEAVAPCSHHSCQWWSIQSLRMPWETSKERIILEPKRVQNSFKHWRLWARNTTLLVIV